jgi:hypothetical protein
MVLLPPGTFNSGEHLCFLFFNFFWTHNITSFPILTRCNTHFHYCRIYWNGTFLWTFIKYVAGVFDSKSVHISKLHHFCWKA